jgi:hypothetical protein
VSLLAITAAHSTSTWLKVRYREQAHSYSFAVNRCSVLTANPCGSWLASDGGGTFKVDVE